MADCFTESSIDYHQPGGFPRVTNLTADDRVALESLRRTPDRIINKADKGTNVVVQDKTDYLFEIQRQLNNTDHYTPLQEPLYPTTTIKLKRVLLDLRQTGHISDEELAFLNPPLEPRPRRMYTLPKIHKNPQDWTIPFRIPPGRPIVSDINSESYNIAKYIDFFLKPIAQAQSSYIKDSFHLLDKLSEFQEVSPSTLLVTCDVESMYTNIDNADGLVAVKSLFEKHQHPRRPDTHILKLLDIYLTNNDFLVGGKFWLQVKGTAMGKVFAPSYANIFMAYLEEAFFTCVGYRPPFYCRYLDDIFFVWTAGESLLQHFLQMFNSFHPSIKLTTHVSMVAVDFLDVTIFKDPPSTTLKTRIHFKVTDTHRLLHKHPFHPRHTFKGIVKRQLSRFHRLSSNHKDFLSAVRTLFDALVDMRYGRRFLKRILHDFLANVYTPQSSRPHTNVDIIPLVFTFHQANDLICRRLLTRLRATGDPLLDNCRLLSARRRNRNLSDILVRNKL